MRNESKDYSVLKHIVQYCDRITSTITAFGDDFAIFSGNHIFQDAIALCILQIGELAGHLSDSFRACHEEIPWRQIRAMRNIMAHEYASVNIKDTWETVIRDVPVLKEHCMRILRGTDILSQA